MKNPNIVSYVEQTANVGTGANRYPFKCAKKVVYITNDSDLYSLRYSFNGYANQYTGILLKAGETDDNIELPPNATIEDISVEGIGGAVPFRVMGV